MFFNSKNLATCPHHPVMVAAMQYCYQCGQIGRYCEVNWITGGPDRADLMSWSSLCMAVRKLWLLHFGMTASRFFMHIVSLRSLSK